MFYQILTGKNSNSDLQNNWLINRSKWEYCNGIIYCWRFSQSGTLQCWMMDRLQCWMMGQTILSHTTNLCASNAGLSLQRTVGSTASTCLCYTKCWYGSQLYAKGLCHGQTLNDGRVRRSGGFCFEYRCRTKIVVECGTKLHDCFFFSDLVVFGIKRLIWPNKFRIRRWSPEPITEQKINLAIKCGGCPRAQSNQPLLWCAVYFVHIMAHTHYLYSTDGLVCIIVLPTHWMWYCCFPRFFAWGLIHWYNSGLLTRNPPVRIWGSMFY